MSTTTTTIPSPAKKKCCVRCARNTHTEQPEIYYMRNRLIGALTDISQTMDPRISQLISFPRTVVRARTSLSFFRFLLFLILCCCCLFVFFYHRMCFCLACLVVNYNKALMPKVKFCLHTKKTKVVIQKWQRKRKKLQFCNIFIARLGFCYAGNRFLAYDIYLSVFFFECMFRCLHSQMRV